MSSSSWSYNLPSSNRQNTAGPSSRPGPSGRQQGLPQPPQDPGRHVPSVRHPVLFPHIPRNRQSTDRRYSNYAPPFQSNSSFPMTAKSAYPSTNPLRISALDVDDNASTRAASSRMSAMSVRSSASESRRSNSGAPLRMEPKAGRFHIVDGEIVPVYDDSDDEDIDMSQPRLPAGRQQVGRKSARKTVSHGTSLDSGPSEMLDDPQGTSTAPSDPPPAKAARKTQVIVISSDSEDEDERAEAEFHAVASHIKLPMRFHAHKMLPFLRRNLRRSFLRTCKTLEIPSGGQGKPKQPIEYVYRYRLTDFTNIIYNSTVTPAWTEYRELIGEWRCPFCDFLGELTSKELLRFHLRSDHGDVASTEWIEDGERSKVVMTLLPPPKDTEPEEFSDDESDVSEDEPEVHVDPPSPDSQSTPPQLSRPDITIKREPLFFPEASLEPPESEFPDTESVTVTSASEEPSLPDSERTSTTPMPGFKLKHELDAERPRFRPGTPPRVRRTGITSDGKLLPPPKDNPYGPAAEPPQDSCRPGGPRIYDLLNELPLEQFGVLAWSIVDREEEIYELVDVRDEDKVMLALWNRWIMLNRMQFIFNGYRNGVEVFLGANYQMIHRAAGWTALRSFLLVLAANRFLTLGEVLKCLAHYEKKVQDDLVQAET